MSDALRPYPTARAYLERQPAGWASHPECVASAQLIARLEQSGALEGLEALQEFVLDDGSGWVSEVAIMTLLLALKDARFDGAALDASQSDESFMAWMGVVNRPLVVAAESADGPWATPQRMQELWHRLHRGTPLMLDARDETGATLTLHHPRDLWPEFVHEWRRRAFLASLASEGAARPTAVIRTVELGTEYQLGW